MVYSSKGIKIIKPSNLQDRLKLIRENPNFYLSPCNIKSLDMFLNGYFDAIEINDLTEDLFESALSFHDWVAMQEGFYESTSGWANMIDSNWSGEEGVTKFFEYLDSYKNRKHRVVKSFRLPEINKQKPWSVIGDSEFIERVSMLSPCSIEIVSYYDGPAVFVRYLDSLGKIIEPEEYRETFELAIELIFRDFEFEV